MPAEQPSQRNEDETTDTGGDSPNGAPAQPEEQRASARKRSAEGGDYHSRRWGRRQIPASARAIPGGDKFRGLLRKITGSEGMLTVAPRQWRNRR